MNKKRNYLQKETNQPMTQTPFQHAFNGSFVALLSWTDFEQCWQRLRQTEASWYIYQPAKDLPRSTTSGDKLRQQLDQIEQYLLQEHRHDYCGIVYVDNPQQPSFIKIYDPTNLGVVCGISQGKPLPGWVLSTMAPETLNTRPTVSRKRSWWQHLFS